jgi:taspase (threonine aspartase 1)
MQTLTLRRVPPNLLVSQGATDFACEMDIPILPYDALVSPAAHERWLRWKADLKSAERKARKNGNSPRSYKLRKDTTTDEEHVRKRMRNEHQKTMLQHNPYLNRPMSPDQSDDSPLFCDVQQNFKGANNPSVASGLLSEGSTASWHSEERSSAPESPLSETIQEPASVAPHKLAESSRSALINSTQKVPTISELRDGRALRDVTGDFVAEDAEMRDIDHEPIQALDHASGRQSYGDGSEESDSTSSAKTMKAPQPPPTTAVHSTLPEAPMDTQIEGSLPRGPPPLNRVQENTPFPPIASHPFSSLEAKEDDITDTVGAIAVDAWGNIACGASSGGIGMKYRGRVGPAALVGVGAAVIPIDPDDVERTCVATVTSGTGEHMATTMAATVCAERLYQSVRKGKGGIYEEVTEDEALKAMIENEFMGMKASWFFFMLC